MTVMPFDTHEFYTELVQSGLAEKTADAITNAFSKAIQQSNENLLSQIKRQYRLDDCVTQYDLRKLELKQDSNFNQFKHDIEMQKIQASIEESKRKTKYWQNLLIAFYVFETLVITFLIAKI